jgi:membrane protein DedA with SNARE-associated domain
VTDPDDDEIDTTAAERDALSEAEEAELAAIVGPPQHPWWARYTVVAWVALVACGYIAGAYYPRLDNEHPEALLALSARVRFLLLATGSDISFPAYAVVAGLRLALAYAVCHLIGRAFGRNVLVWFGRYLGVKPKQIQDMLQLFHRGEWFVVPFFTGSNLVAAITGITRTPLRRLVPLVTIGIVGRLVLWWWVAQVADDEVDAVIDFLDRYQMPALIASIVITVIVIAINLWRGRDFQLDS